MRILIAEDDLTSRVMLSSVLQKWNYQAVCTVDGDEAWNVLSGDGSPQIVLLDWQMPGKTGLELCKMLRSQTRTAKTYVIMLTSKSDKNDIVTGLKAGANDYIVKPFDYHELKARLDAGRRIIELQDELARKEKLQGVLEMAGAVCHELNQPLQALQGWSEILLLDKKPDDPDTEKLNNIKESVRRISDITRRIMRISKYESMSYLDSRIVDIHKSCGAGA